MRRRIGRIFRVTLAVVPLLLVAALWARSYRRLDVLWLVRDDGTTRALAARRGAIHVVDTSTNGRRHGVTWDSYRIPAAAGRAWPPTLHYPENLIWFRAGFGHVVTGAPPPLMLITGTAQTAAAVPPPPPLVPVAPQPPPTPASAPAPPAPSPPASALAPGTRLALSSASAPPPAPAPASGAAPARVGPLVIISGPAGLKGPLTITGPLLGPTPGFGVDLVPWLVGRPYEEWVIPLWPLALIAAAPPTVMASRAARRAHRRRHNHCPTCGYDLRGAPENAGVATCPECGTVAAAMLAAVPS